MRLLAPVAGPDVDPVDSPARRLSTRIIDLHRQLEAAPTLEPGPAIDPLFTSLVAACAPSSAERTGSVLRDPGIARLAARIRELCCEGEYRLERAWARRIIAAEDPVATLAAFPYWANYASLTRLELHALAGVGFDRDRATRVCFIGGGPLPLSALMLAERLSLPVDVVDRDGEAVSLAAGVCRRLSPAAVRIYHGEAAAFPGLADCDAVVLAALVGASGPEKRAVLGELHAAMRPGSMLVVRSAHGLRTLLYPALDLDDLRGWTPLAVVHPLSEVVNSVVVMIRRSC